MSFKGKNYGNEILSKVPEGRLDEGTSKLFTGGFQRDSWQEKENCSSGRGWRVWFLLVYRRGGGGCAGRIIIRKRVLMLATCEWITSGQISRPPNSRLITQKAASWPPITKIKCQDETTPTAVYSTSNRLRRRTLKATLR